VTYVHEVNAQFAREAMACQSMDNDEILNVRWATEDPNPTTKVIEKRRLEEIGTKAIQGKLDPRMVDAMRSIRALEEGEDLHDGAEDGMDGSEEEASEEPASKRRKMEEAQPEEPPRNGLLSAETLKGIKALAEMRNKRAGVKPVVSKPGLSALAAYGSDDDDDE
jgi:hypothetical protein